MSRPIVPTALACFAVLAASAGCCHAQAVDGLPDASFGNLGQNVIAFDRGGTNRDTARALLVDGSNRTTLIGDVDTTSGRRIGLTRLLPGGGVDDAFGGDGNGRVVFPASGSSIGVTSAAWIPSGGFVVAGSRSVGPTDSDMLVCRFSADGEPVDFAAVDAPCVEVPFNVGGLGNDIANSVLVQPDGAIVLAGDAETASARTMAFARLLPDGSLDDGFGVDGRITYTGGAYTLFSAQAIRRLQDGSFAVAGAGDDENHAHFGVLVRLSASGQPDTGYSNHGYARSTSSNIAYVDVLHDRAHDRFISIGNVGGGATRKAFIQCVRASDGALVSCPGTNASTASISPGYDLRVSHAERQSDGGILLAGTYRATAASASDAIVLRIVGDYLLDTEEFAAPLGYAAHDYGLGGAQDSGLAFALAGGRVLVAGASLRTANGTNDDFSVAAFGLDRIFRNDFQP